MSDNLPPEVVQQELEARLRIPTEVWTDVFKLLPRSVLVQQVAPVCYQFKEISNKNVKNVHVIEHADQFTKKLEEEDPDVNEQLENLVGSNCELASQFKLSKVRIGDEKSQAILRHCPDLFNGCQISLYFGSGEENKNSTLILESLDQLETAKPIKINVRQEEDQVTDFWHHPTYLNCSRVRLTFWSDLSNAAVSNIFDWLHHQPTGVDCDGSIDDQQVRCMIVWRFGTSHVHIDWLINRCSENIQQAREPLDRRSFVLSFDYWIDIGQFRRIENHLTGETLVLDRVMNANGQPTLQYRLRRCLAQEETGGEEFYAGIFKQDNEVEQFKFDQNKPRVMIG